MLTLSQEWPWPCALLIAEPVPLLREKLVFDADSLGSLDHLVMVAGHAVVLAEGLDQVDREESAWYLERYQRGQGLPKVFVRHARLGVQVAAADPRALLIFSGGQTRSAAGPRDEGSSYYRVAEHNKWWGREDVSVRTVTEDFATDSFQNLLFSICRFKEVVGRYPVRITVVSFSFKRRRFEELHRAALRFPLVHFDYVSHKDLPFGFDLAAAERGERENAAKAFEADPYGCHSPSLAAKRRSRNPFRRTTPYSLSCEELRGLLNWCGPNIFREPLPWAPHSLAENARGTWPPPI